MGDNCYVTEDANWAVVKARLLAAGHTVTTGNFPATLAGFQQFWDMRYNTALTAADRALLIPFITNGGYAFLQTEHAGFVARNDSVAALITDMGGGTTTIGASNAADVSAQVNELYITPGTIIHFSAIAAIENSKGRWMVKDASNRIQVMAWVGRAGDLSPGVTGTILTISDINWLDPGYHTVTNVAALDDIIRGIVAGTVSGTIGPGGNNSSAPPPPALTDGFPMEWKTGYRLWMKEGKFGFNNGAGDLYGVDANTMSEYSGRWVFVTATFHNTTGGSTYVNNNKLYFNGKPQTLSQQLGSPTSGTAGIGITLANSTNPSATPDEYEFDGDISEVYVYNRELSPTEVMQMYYATKDRYPPPPITTTTTSTTTSTTTTAPPPAPPLPPGVSATNAAWGGNGFGPLAYPGTFVGHRGGFSAAASHMGNGGGGSGSPLGGEGGSWASPTGGQGDHGTGASGGGYATAGVAGIGAQPGYSATAVQASGIGNGGGGVETDGANSSTAPINGGNGTGGLLRIIITSGTYTFTNADLTTFGATRLTDSGKGIEWDHSTSTSKRASADLYEHALLATFTVPAGVTKISVGIIAGGGGGATGPCVNAGGGGGGAGLLTNYPVTAGTQYKIKVGAGGRGGTQPTDRGSAGGPPYGVTDAPWRGGRTAFCKADDTEIIYATGGNTRPDNCAAVANSDTPSANTRD